MVLSICIYISMNLYMWIMYVTSVIEINGNANQINDDKRRINEL